MNELAIIIPAVKKNVAFPDDLVKKLAGISLIQRTIDLAIETIPKAQVVVLTDSKEIELICERNGVMVIYNAAMRIAPDAYVRDLIPYVRSLTERYNDFLVLSPYVPLINKGALQDAYRHFCKCGAEFLVPVTQLRATLFSPWPRTLAQMAQGGGEHWLTCESHAFIIFNREFLQTSENQSVNPVAYPIDGRLIEIRNYEDWWLCEKLLNRRRIVFRVIGHKTVGMGHIFRSLSLAHEISDHEIRFVCDTASSVAATKLAGYDYWLGVYEPDEIEQAIIDLKPDMVINDIIDTEAAYICRLKHCGIRVVNFEDLGSGSSEADLTINDLYDEPLLPGANILWGHTWFFVRDEFTGARQHVFQAQVQRLLITFGGTDPSDFTRKILGLVAPYCAEHGIAVDVVTGDGYEHIPELEAMIKTLPAEVTYTHATGVISRVMEGTQLAICSNGRTVYELAHMSIPAIILSHHERERTHRFAQEERGFVQVDATNLGQVLDTLRQLVEDTNYRRKLFGRMSHIHFGDNKRKVVRRLLELLETAGA